ncbi:hypothetical protein PG993_009698 [Apiospora rasikravindrae]|uniref:Gfd2/YDR514C-like C-terminal domain-containing protein n=1 Tax=Apiospora rasikravindrae TaxID=990691 RepID=A0ABR1SK44_9PEZI
MAAHSPHILSPPTRPNCPVSRLLQKPVRTLQEYVALRHAGRCGFLSLDCEFVSDVHWDTEPDPAKVFASQAPTEVGLAFAHGPFRPATAAAVGTRKEPSLQDFYRDLHVEAISIKVQEPYLEKLQQLAQKPAMGEKGRGKLREEFQFGESEFVPVKQVETRVCQAVKQYRDSAPGAKVVLVGYALDADFNAMRQTFPALADLCDSFLDLNTLIRSDVFTVEAVVEPPGVRSLLKLFGYPQDDYGLSESMYHNAGNDAVKTLALLDDLARPEHIETLRLRQQIPHEILLCEDVKLSNFTNVAFVRPADHMFLPTALDSVLKLAVLALPYRPQMVGMHKQLKKMAESSDKISVLRGWVRFSSAEDVRAFVEAKDRVILGGTEVRIVLRGDAASHTKMATTGSKADRPCETNEIDNHHGDESHAEEGFHFHGLFE